MISLSKVKNIYHSAPQPLKNILLRVPYGVFLGAKYRNYLKYLQHFDLLPQEEKIARSEIHLLSYLNDAIVDTPFYTDFAKTKGWSKIESMDQFFELPLITKGQITEDLKWFTPEHVKKRYRVTTGGTSGKQTELFMSNEAFKREWAFKAMLLKKSGVDINSKRICLRGVDFYGSKSVVRYNPLYKEIQVSPFRLNAHNINDVLREIEMFKPEWVHGYPSSVYEFARLCQSLNLSNVNLKAALLVSERLFTEQAEMIQSVLGVKLLSFYGMTERVIFAPKLKTGDFIPDLAYGYTEEKNGQLIGTGFINNATRLIRYCTGDDAEVKKDGELVTSITFLKGRWGKEYLVGKGGAHITMTSLNVHSEELFFVKCYQFFQNTPGICELRVVLNTGYNPSKSELGKARFVFQRKVDGVLDIELVVVDEIPLTIRGKHKFIESTLI